MVRTTTFSFVDPEDPTCSISVSYTFDENAPISQRIESFRRCCENMSRGVILKNPPKMWGNHATPASGR